MKQQTQVDPAGVMRSAAGIVRSARTALAVVAVMSMAAALPLASSTPPAAADDQTETYQERVAPFTEEVPAFNYKTTVQVAYNYEERTVDVFNYKTTVQAAFNYENRTVAAYNYEDQTVPAFNYKTTVQAAFNYENRTVAAFNYVNRTVAAYNYVNREVAAYNYVTPCRGCARYRVAPFTKTVRVRVAPFTRTVRVRVAPFTKTVRVRVGPYTETVQTRVAPFTKTVQVRVAPFTKTERVRVGPYTETVQVRVAPFTKTVEAFNYETRTRPAYHTHTCPPGKKLQGHATCVPDNDDGNGDDGNGNGDDNDNDDGNGDDGTTTTSTTTTAPPPPSKPVVSITAGPNIIEGGTAQFTVTADPAPTQPLTVALSTLARGVSLRDSSHPVCWTSSCEKTATRTVTLRSASETVLMPTLHHTFSSLTAGSITATVNAAGDYTVSTTRGAATVTVEERGSLPVVSITAGPAINEGGTARFTVAVDPVMWLPLTVFVEVSGDALLEAETVEVKVPANDATASFSVATRHYYRDEPDSSVTAAVRTSSVYTVSTTQGSAAVTVKDVDTAPTGGPYVSIWPHHSAVHEHDTARFRVEAHHEAPKRLTVNVQVTQVGGYGLSAAIKTHAVTIQKGGRWGWVDVPLVDDSTDEPAGQITAAVKSGVGYNVPPQEHQATVTVHDDDCPSGYQKKPLPVNYFHVLTGEMTTDRDVALNWSPQPPGGEWAARGEWVMSTDPGDPGCFTLTRPDLWSDSFLGGLAADLGAAYNGRIVQTIIKGIKIADGILEVTLCEPPQGFVTSPLTPAAARLATKTYKLAAKAAAQAAAQAATKATIVTSVVVAGYCVAKHNT